jgi:hypothetical protein
MKTEIKSTELILETWKMGVENLLFPDFIINDLQPVKILDAWDDDLPKIRTELRVDVDIFINRIFELETPQELWTLLRKTDQKIMALYYDRILAATYTLDQIKQENEFADVPESWDTLNRALLFQKPFLLGPY